MLGKFVYSNPTKLYFGENSLENLPQELACYGKNVMLVYGGGSIKKNGANVWGWIFVSSWSLKPKN